MLAQPPQADTDIGMPIELYLTESHHNPFEIINGERVPKMPSGWIHSEIIRLIFRLLDAFVTAHQLGDVYAETTFIFPHTSKKNWVTGSRIPDVMFYAGSQVRDFIQTAEDKNLPLAIVPDLIIEVLSPTDTFSQIDEKVSYDLANGVKMVWLIDPNRRKAWVYTPDTENSQVFGAEGVLTAEEILPNFKLELAKLWR
ncbi:MAG: Uma2 family endonuclease [Anaerolineae bacterium]|jgi:Uma2 family endonuclease|nr:Uma2 family endonuclease [Anaerolineae bacterium]